MNMMIWDALKQPPKSALKQIQAGRLKGKTDINPQWRYQAMTNQFGPCGIGWKYTIKKIWNEPAADGQVFAFAEVDVFIRIDDTWSEPIPGIGGSMLVTNEKNGVHSSDEGYKMAVTDALSVALKMLGVAADVYAGLWDGSKYGKEETTSQKPPETKPLVKAQGEQIIAYAQEKLALVDEETRKVIDWYCAKNGRTYQSGEYLIANFGTVFDEYQDEIVGKIA